MARVVIFNATAGSINLKKGSINKHVGDFGESYIDTIITTGYFKVIDEFSKKMIASFTIKACDSYSYFVFENKNGELELSGRYSLWDPEPRKVRDAARRVYEEKAHV